EELFDENGAPVEKVVANTPEGDRRMAVNPITNGGVNPKELVMPNYRDFAVDVKNHGTEMHQDMLEWGKYIAKMIELNPTTFRGFGPDESKSNRLYAALDSGKRTWMEDIHEPNDEDLRP
ncbi:phosphoketolase, partial [Klebsiella pneumoniae]|nr:phosphoketolase [Klebsiella pneumoniae]